MVQYSYCSDYFVKKCQVWSLYLTSPDAFDLFSRCFLRFFSGAWVGGLSAQFPNMTMRNDIELN